MKPCFFILSILLLLALSLASCEKEGSNDLIKSYFTEEFPDKEIDLSQRLGPVLALLDGKDTMMVFITYEKASQNNFITDTSSEDTLFAGKVYKYRGLYYFCRKVEDSVYMISAVKVKKDRIKGLGTEFRQMHAMDQDLETNPASLLTGLVQKNKPEYALKPDRKILSGYFTSMVDSLPEFRIININETKMSLSTEAPVIPQKDIQATRSVTSLISSVYPNPIRDVLNLKMNFPANYQVRLLNDKQEVVLQQQFNNDQQSILMNHIPSGTYILQLICDDFKGTESIRIVVR